MWDTPTFVMGVLTGIVMTGIVFLISMWGDR